MKSHLLLKISTITVLATLFSGCVSTLMTEEQPQEKKFEGIAITEKAADLLNTETDLILIREELVCKNEAKLGTRFKTNVCSTQSELDAMAENARRETSTAQRNYSPTD